MENSESFCCEPFNCQLPHTTASHSVDLTKRRLEMSGISWMIKYVHISELADIYTQQEIELVTGARNAIALYIKHLILVNKAAFVCIICAKATIEYCCHTHRIISISWSVFVFGLPTNLPILPPHVNKSAVCVRSNTLIYSFILSIAFSWLYGHLLRSVLEALPAHIELHQNNDSHSHTLCIRA